MTATSLSASTTLPGPRITQVKILSRHIVQLSREGCEELWRDVRAVKWIRFFVWFTFLSWLACLATAIGFSTTTPRNLDGDGYCLPDGTFDPEQYGSYNIFNPSGFFQITLGYGELHFATAKLIDILWDVVCSCHLLTQLSFFTKLNLPQ
jgi:hypothetical protein